MLHLNKLLCGLAFGSVVTLGMLAEVSSAADDHEHFDLAILSGRLVDPANQRDGAFNIGIKDGRVAAVTTDPLTASQVIDAEGLIVAPGFIDLHSHAMSPRGQDFQLLDGVTTALELEAGSFPVAALDGHFPSGAVIHYGASSSHLAVRQRVLGNTEQPHFTDPATAVDEGSPFDPRLGFITPASARQISAMMALHRAAIADGALGIGLPVDYMSSAVSSDELEALFSVAAGAGVPVFVHMRRGLPGDLSGLDEMLGLARATGAPVHICHLQASVMSGTAEALRRIAAAVAEGVAVTTEAYPYNAGSTSIGAAVFHRDWQQIFAIDYDDVQWTATGERLTEATFKAYQQRDPDGFVVHHYGDSATTEEALIDPMVMVASDAMPLNANTTFAHPRGMGSFVRVLSRYVDEFDAEGPLSLSGAIAKMTVAPARLLEGIHRGFVRKGQLGVGADADIVVFDPETLGDRATYLQPLAASRGVVWALVCGEVVVAGGERIAGRFPGRNLNRSPGCAAEAARVR